MNTKHNLTLIILMVVLLASACTGGGNDQKSGGFHLSLGSPVFNGFHREELGTYSAVFSVRFTGNSSWVYQLNTRKSAQLREENLHLEGIDPARNPGDVRLVTDGQNTWMIGPGTDNECVRFPNNQGMDPSFVLPDSLASAADLEMKLAYMGEEVIAGRQSLHFSGKGLSLGGWRDALVDVWQAKDNRALLRFTLRGSGEDPFFGSGSGAIEASYNAQDLDEAPIEPVAGCEINAPIPEAASKNLVRLPGMASFDSQVGVEEMTAYYLWALTGAGWQEKEAPASAAGASVLSYTRGAESLEVHIEAAEDGGSKVTLLFGVNE